MYTNDSEESLLQEWNDKFENANLQEWLAKYGAILIGIYGSSQYYALGMPHKDYQCIETSYCPRHGTGGDAAKIATVREARRLQGVMGKGDGGMMIDAFDEKKYRREAKQLWESGEHKEETWSVALLQSLLKEAKETLKPEYREEQRRNTSPVTEAVVESFILAKEIMIPYLEKELHRRSYLGWGSATQ